MMFYAEFASFGVRVCLQKRRFCQLADAWQPQRRNETFSNMTQQKYRKIVIAEANICINYLALEYGLSHHFDFKLLCHTAHSNESEADDVVKNPVLIMMQQGPIRSKNSLKFPITTVALKKRLLIMSHSLGPTTK